MHRLQSPRFSTLVDVSFGVNTLAWGVLSLSKSRGQSGSLLAGQAAEGANTMQLMGHSAGPELALPELLALQQDHNSASVCHVWARKTLL